MPPTTRSLAAGPCAGPLRHLTSRSRPVLRIAVPNKGVLSEPAAEMLAESGYRQRRSTKDLAVYDPDNDTEFFYLRPRDIAVYVGAGDARRRHHRPRHAAGDRPVRRRGPGGGRGHAAGLRAVVVPLRRARRVGHRTRSTSSPASGSPPPTRCCCSATWTSRGIKAERGQARRRGGDRLPARAWPTPSATSSRPGRRCGPPGLHIIGPPVLTSEADPRAPGGRRGDPRRGAAARVGCAASWSPAST